MMENDDSSDSVEIPIGVQKIESSNIGGMRMHDEDLQPFIEIVEQPQARGFRFRYECEGPSHGGLQGERSEKYRKSFPSIRIKNYNGPARIVVTLVTNEEIPRPHAHKLVGKNCSNGSCVVELRQGPNITTFPNLCIQHVTRRKASEVIEQRILESMKLDKLVKLGNLNAQADLSDDEKQQAASQAGQLAKDMQLNVVRLCFQAYLRDESGQFSRLLPPVLSAPIYDSKAPGANALKICRMDKYGGCCTGNEEVFLLCERVQKDDIQVRFVEQDDDGNTVWEAYGNFGPFDVHRQYAIVFKTPPYKDPNIDRPVHVIIMLQRKSDTETSDPKAFTYYPQSFDKDEIAKKRKKTLPSYPGGSGYGSGGGGEDGRPSINTNGYHNGPLSFPATQGNIPVMVNDTEQTADPSENLHNSSPSLTKPINKRRINKAKRNKAADLEVDGTPRVQILPTVLSDPSHAPVTGPPDLHINFTAHPNIQANFPFQFQQYQGMSQILIPRGGGGALTVGGARSDSDSCSGMDEVDATVCETVKDLRLDQEDSVLIQDKMMPQDDDHHSNQEEDEEIGDIESDGISLHPTDKSHSCGESTHSEDKHVFCDSKSDQIDKKSTNQATSERDVCEDQETDFANEHTCDCSGTANRVSAVMCDAGVQTEKDDLVKTAERTVKALHMFASTGDIRHILMVQRYLTSVCDHNGDIPLHTAIINGQTDVVNNLIDVMKTMPNLWLKINAYNNLLQTPLHVAVLTGQDEVIDHLLCAGANTKLPDRNGNTPAHLAVNTGNTKCLARLLKYQRPFTTPDNPFPELNMKNFDGFTTAHIAASTGNLQAVKLLLQCKSDMNMADGKSGKTPLHYAVEQEDLSVTGYLILEARVFVDSTCFNGNTALHIACGRQNAGLVALLMAAGANPDIENSEEMRDRREEAEEDRPLPGHRPRDYAAGNAKILKILKGEQYRSDGHLVPSSITSPREDSYQAQVYQEVDAGLSHDPVSQDHHSASPMEPTLSQVMISNEDGDIEKINYQVRVQLSKMLDSRQQGRDWVTLSEKLGLRQAIEGHQSGFSPTRLLLTFYESCGGTIFHLLEALVAMDRYDAVELINSSLNLQTDDCKTAMQNSSGMDLVDRSILIHHMAS